MLADDLLEHFTKSWRSGPVVVLGRCQLDITQALQLEAAFEKYLPSVVINAAAYTNVDGAESNREAAYAANVEGPKLLAEFCKKKSAKLVHFSTDQVFNGQNTLPWTEDLPTSPLNYYALTKTLGETEVLRAPGALVLRVQWLYGKRKDRFTILRGKKVFTPFLDQFGAPTWTRDLCKITEDLLQAGGEGIFHIAYDDHASWAEVFQYAIELLDLDLTLVPQKTADVILPAKRPLYCVLSNRKLLSFLGRDKMGSWKDSLREFLSTSTSKSWPTNPSHATS
jgi:dTDP-4-dehydrorhamnose reductase